MKVELLGYIFTMNTVRGCAVLCATNEDGTMWTTEADRLPDDEWAAKFYLIKCVWFTGAEKVLDQKPRRL